jgi:putative transposase
MNSIELDRHKRITRIFRAKRKITIPEIVSHITQRAAGKDPLFLEETDYLCLLSKMKEITAKRSLDIYAFCLMPNHIHLLVSPQAGQLQDSMRDLFSRYAMVFNRRYQRKGHLFGGPYRQSVCLDEKYLLAASLYIHLNPVRAGLVSDPFQYRWSSCRLYEGNRVLKSFVNNSFILNLISPDQRVAKQVYKSFLSQTVGVETKEVLEEESAIHRMLGQLKSLFPHFWKGINPRSLKNPAGLELLDDEALTREIERLKQKGALNQVESRKAKKFLMEQFIARGFKRNEIAERLGVSVKTIYNYLN